MIVKSVIGLPVRPAYTLADMAADGIGLLDHLGIDRAHVVGVSMGGMISQHIAARYPQRILSLTRSEEHTSELQSLMRISYAVFCLKKKKIQKIQSAQHETRTATQNSTTH